MSHGPIEQNHVELLTGLPFARAFRLRFIDFLLDQYGTVNRRAIVDYFGLSQPQATLDLRKYSEIAPDNLAYDLKAKTYRRTDKFKRIWQ